MLWGRELAVGNKNIYITVYIFIFNFKDGHFNMEGQLGLTGFFWSAPQVDTGGTAVLYIRLWLCFGGFFVQVKVKSKYTSSAICTGHTQNWNVISFWSTVFKDKMWIRHAKAHMQLFLSMHKIYIFPATLPTAQCKFPLNLHLCNLAAISVQTFWLENPHGFWVSQTFCSEYLFKL